MIEAVLVRDNPHMSEAVQENQRSKLESFITGDRLRAVPQASCTHPRKLDSCVIKDTPNKSGAVIPIRAR